MTEEANDNSENENTEEGTTEETAASNDSSSGDTGSFTKPSEGPKGAALEVSVDKNVEKAMKVLKRKLIKEGLFKELKLRRYYEKPSDRRKRKGKESVKKIRKEEARLKKNPYF